MCFKIKMLIVSVFQNSMNLPPDKVRLLRSYDNEKKWELICDQVGGVNKVNEFDSVPTWFGYRIVMLHLYFIQITCNVPNQRPSRDADSGGHLF